MMVFQDLPPMSVEAFRADQDRYACEPPKRSAVSVAERPRT